MVSYKEISSLELKKVVPKNYKDLYWVFRNGLQRKTKLPSIGKAKIFYIGYKLYHIIYSNFMK